MRSMEPCGLLQCTCEKFPKVTHMNATMMEFLGITEEYSNWYEFLKENIFFMIPFEERETFQNYLKNAHKSEDPFYIHHNVLCSDGHELALTGWLELIHPEEGDDYFAFTYMEPSRESVALNKLNNWVEYLIPKDQGSLGMILLEEENKHFSVVYVSPNICEYLHLSEQEYLRYVSGELPAERFLEKISLSGNRLQELFHTQELDFPSQRGNEFREGEYRLTCTAVSQGNKILHEILLCHSSSGAPASSASPAVSLAPVEEKKKKPEIFARTFGHFDLFVNDMPVTFSSAREKELMALLIDRNGGTLSASEAINYLWDGEPVTDKLSNRYRKLAMGLKNTLVNYGIEHILINHHGIRSINVSAITCDYYELLAGNPQYKQMFHNTYMTDYSWAEETLASLWQYS